MTDPRTSRELALKGFSTVTPEMIDAWADAQTRAAAADTSTAEPVMPPWSTVDFRPAPDGWRLVFVNAEFGCHRIEHMAGWLIQQRTYNDPNTRRRETCRRVMPAAHGDTWIWGGEVLDADDLAAGDELYAVLAPEQDDPTEDEIKAHVQQLRGDTGTEN